MDRRRFLRTAGLTAVAGVGLAGCSSPGDEEDGDEENGGEEGGDEEGALDGAASRSRRVGGTATDD